MGIWVDCASGLRFGGFHMLDVELWLECMFFSSLDTWSYWLRNRYMYAGGTSYIADDVFPFSFREVGSRMFDLEMHNAGLMTSRDCLHETFAYVKACGEDESRKIVHEACRSFYLELQDGCPPGS
jgi:hypothetical protein